MMDARSNAPEGLAAAREEHQAVLVLRTLERESSGTLNDRLLNWVLDHYALGCERDALLALLDRLERQDLVSKVDGSPEVVIVRLTERGERVALGRDRAEGVLRVFSDCPY